MGPRSTVTSSPSSTSRVQGTPQVGSRTSWRSPHCSSRRATWPSSASCSQPTVGGRSTGSGKEPSHELASSRSPLRPAWSRPPTTRTSVDGASTCAAGDASPDGRRCSFGGRRSSRHRGERCRDGRSRSARPPGHCVAVPHRSPRGPQVRRGASRRPGDSACQSFRSLPHTGKRRSPAVADRAEVASRTSWCGGEFMSCPSHGAARC